MIHGCNTPTPTERAYQEYILAGEYLKRKVSKKKEKKFIGLIHASAPGAAVVTAAISLHRQLKYLVPQEGKVEDRTWVSTSTPL